MKRSHAEYVTTRRMMESILAVEEEHADDLSTFLKQFGVDLYGT